MGADMFINRKIAQPGRCRWVSGSMIATEYGTSNRNGPSTDRKLYPGSGFRKIPATTKKIKAIIDMGYILHVDLP
jgi:hypothetical protein